MSSVGPPCTDTGSSLSSTVHLFFTICIALLHAEAPFGFHTLPEGMSRTCEKRGCILPLISIMKCRVAFYFCFPVVLLNQWRARRLFFNFIYCFQMSNMLVDSLYKQKTPKIPVGFYTRAAFLIIVYIFHNADWTQLNINLAGILRITLWCTNAVIKISGECNGTCWDKFLGCNKWKNEVSGTYSVFFPIQILVHYRVLDLWQTVDFSTWEHNLQ